MLFTAIGGLSAQEHSQAAGDAQKEAIGQMIAKLDAVGMPPDQSAKLILDQYKQAGILTPALMDQVNQQVSQFQSVKSDPTAMNMQYQALQRMSQLGQAGLTPDERAQQRLLQGQVQQQNNSNQQSIIQNMAQRGQQGSGAEMAARLGASQGAANQASSGADRVSSMAAQRALQAIGQTGGMANQLESQQFGEQATKAGAMDQMNRFNTQNQMAINQANVGAQNQSKVANLANAQQVSNANVNATNQEQYKALDRQRQNWLDKMAYAGAYQQPLSEYGQAHAGQELSKAKSQAALGSGIDNSIWKVLGMVMGKAPSSGGKNDTSAGGNTGSDNEDMESNGNDSKGGGFGSSMA